MPRGRTVAIVSAVAVVAAAGIGGGAYYVLHTRGSPLETAQRFTAAWARGDHAAMKAELAAPAPGFDAAYAQLTENLGVTNVSISGLRVSEPADGKATATYTATAKLKGIGEWTYQGRLALTVKDRHWKVDWSPSAVHPALDGATKLRIKVTWPPRAAITDANGRRIDGGDVGGSVQQLVGYLDKATAKDVKRLGPPYRVRDLVGRAGLQATFERRLAGTPTIEIQAVGSSTETLHRFEGTPGEELRTTLDLRVQRAAADAVRNVEEPAALVAVRPSTGEILAVANNRGGFNRALEGRYPPGSTFKAITAAGLLGTGLTPSSRVTCPKTVIVGGLRIRNSDYESFGSVSLREAFAHSCNTTFAPLAASRLGAKKLHELAGSFGFNQPLNIGVPAVSGSMPRAESDAELAAESFGQARITASPLVMASVAAAVADGTWRPPTLVRSLKQKATPKKLPDEVVAHLRAMMRAVVTEGTARGAGLPSGTAGKTGSAEFGTGPELGMHAWFIGYRGDLAFAVVVEGGGMGGKVAAPIAARFLKALG
ncbi:penicillin-binding transpeptidase domain-containing protein [Thermobispora bispora]|uniref:Penicillin-binding protein transpeptidase n=1 Tax=Thermobispora bispora (strain ATCC 19993 / DSM 43833 / CBS 139.67 / JCM 10125 / KCTC 9307 / NBRC 14880 / R51) TaxID=469371 RepID=D6YB80_THEBD|nr:penicillin-binding transpeptidase domain-containing protein [Thermobispora bispora]ADG88440.1 penicillin-binding protein transpeptidase [Thermobispora bispora DSM 43833]QSI48254.1 cell division protein FtsI [Thermobispora bispora]